jgi:acetyl esterase/lipase
MRLLDSLTIGVALIFAIAAPTAAQTTAAATRFIEVANGYRLTPNITYLRAGGKDLKLDVYQPTATTEATPTLMYMHGGGWTSGNKEGAALTFLPYLEMGWAVVNVQYRLADDAHAPAAVEDCRCALRWVYQNAANYRFDVGKIVTTGNSAGGHLALTTGMLTDSAGLDRQCPGDRRRAWTTGTLSTTPLEVAAIVNWYGITDVYDLAHRPPGSSGNFTEAWLGSATDRDDVARRASPISYVRAELPPILSIHGDADPIVPYDQAVRLHEALDAAGAPNRLVTVPGGGHGGFSDAEMSRIYGEIREFFARHGIASPPSRR